MGRKKTHEEYVAEVAAINPNIEVIGMYINAKTKILHRCKNCVHEWYIRPNDILNGVGCPMCRTNAKKPHEQYVQEVELKNPNIKVIGKYSGNRTKILHECIIDGYKWEATPSNILRGTGCPKCSKRARRTHEEYVNDVEAINSSIVVVDRFIDVNTKLKHRCAIDGYEWMAFPSHILDGTGCPKCAGNAKKTHEEYVDKLKENNAMVIAVGKYITRSTKIEHECLFCGYRWLATPANILSGTGCPECKKSRGEKTVESWLNNNKINYESQKRFSNCKDKYSLPFDFYLPDYNMLIEYQGKQHYEPIDYFGGYEAFNGNIRRDKIKENYCKENNIRLFIIPYFEDINMKLKELSDLIITKEVAA